ncbi:MAG: cell division protein FtsA [Kiritimatiellae bacterium]|nr:cell division protein FtsA [Kiritimatiellia bacterium]
MSSIHAALEIGTSKTVLAVGEATRSGRVKVSCHAEIPSTGVRKSQILDISQASQSIRSVLQEIVRKQSEAGSSITIRNAFLVVSGQHVKVDPFIGSVPVEGGRVGEEAINAVLRASRTMALPRDRELLDVVEQDYVVDNLGAISSPNGMSGNILRLNTLQIHADSNRIMNARTAADAAHIEIREPLFAATCAAEAVLEDYEKRNGALVLDVGGGSTGYAAYSDGMLVSAGVIGVGGDHVTNDIAHAFQTTNAQAEDMKIRESRALVTREGDASRVVKVDAGESTLMDNRTVSRRALDTVVNARLAELFTVLRENLEDQDVLHRLHTGVVLTGGGSRLRDIDALASQMLGISARYGRPIHIDGLEEVEYPPEFAAISGALLYAHRNYEEHSVLDGILGRFFR